MIKEQSVGGLLLLQLHPVKNEESIKKRQPTHKTQNYILSEDNTSVNL